MRTWPLGVRLAPWGLFAAAMTMLQIAEFALAEILVVVSTLAFFIQIFRWRVGSRFKAAVSLLVVSMNVFLMTVVYKSKSKSNRAWSNVLPSQTSQQQTRSIQDPRQQRHLLDQLKGHAHQKAVAHILFANIKHRPLADTFVSIFQLAGWGTNLTKVALESYRHEFYEGIEVHGYNKYLVDSVAEAMSSSGVPQIRKKLEASQMESTNPKWEWVQHRINITIGHYD